MKRVVIIGAGATGCFCAIQLKRACPHCDVVVLERASRPLAKVAITGGGRCNLTNSFAMVRSLKEVYPRGEKVMKRALKVFSNKDAMSWFEAEGVRLVTQDDECVFPASQDAMEIVRTLTGLMQRLGVKLQLNTCVEAISRSDMGYHIAPLGLKADAVVVATGSPRKERLETMFRTLPLELLPTLPSLFTFKVDDEALHALMGIVVEEVNVKLSATKFAASGPLLITHWGLSGPAILKLSSHAARHLAECAYCADVVVNWFGEMKEPDIADLLRGLAVQGPHRQLSNLYPERFVQRHWLYLCGRAGLSADKRWQDVGPKQMNRLAALLAADTYHVTGRGQNKDEFVTCGGVSLSNLDPNTFECRQHPGLYFAGEVTDVDAVTGGFNLQAAWTMGYVVAQAIASR